MSRRTTRLDRRTTAASLTAANSTAAGAAEAIAHLRRIQLHSSDQLSEGSWTGLKKQLIGCLSLSETAELNNLLVDLMPM